MKKQKTITNVLLVLLVILILLVYVFPYIYLVLTSFKHPDDVLSVPPTLIPQRLSLQNYIRIGDFPHIPKTFLNSAIIAVMSTTLTLLLAVPAAYAVARYSTFGSRVFMVMALGVRMIPYISIAIPLFFIMKTMQVTDTYIAVALAHMTINLPLAIWLMASFMEGVPVELEEAARVDGCTRLSALVRIIIPISMGGIAVTAIFSFLASWNDLLFALFLTSVNAKTAPLAIAEFNSQFGVDWGTMTALAALFSLPVILVSLLLQKRIVAGATQGAVKG
jgi:multiple sugar transport system permease protein